MCECLGTDFMAHVRSEGGARILRIEGTCTCPQAGYNLRLEPDNPGIVPDPREVVLRIAVTAPNVAAEVLTPTIVEYEGEVAPEAERVLIRQAQGDDIILALAEGADTY